MIKAIIFDLDGTLLNRDESVKAFIAEQYERLIDSLHPIPKEQYIQRFIELDQRGYVWKDKVYKQLLEEFSISDMTWEELLEDYLTYFKENCVPFPHLIQTLEKLKQDNFMVGMITNGKGLFQFDNIKALKIAPYIDAVLISDWEKVKKPDPVIFRRALERLKVQPEESVFVGDHPEKDVKAAQNVGMIGIWKRDYQWNKVEADYIIDELDEIPNVIQQINAVIT